MTESVIIAIVGGIVTCIGTIAATTLSYFSLLAKLKYGAQKAEEAANHAQTAVVKAEEAASAVVEKIDENTALTTEVKNVATKASDHAISCDREKVELLRRLTEHDARINSLESDIKTMKVLVDGVNTNITSSRHEMRDKLSGVMYALNLIIANNPALAALRKEVEASGK